MLLKITQYETNKSDTDAIIEFYYTCVLFKDTLQLRF